MNSGRQACQEKNKKIIFLQWLINIACNKYIKDSYQRTYMLNLLKVINFWLKTHNMTGTQSLEISYVHFKDQIEFQLSWVEIADKYSVPLASKEIVTLKYIAHPLGQTLSWVQEIYWFLMLKYTHPLNKKISIINVHLQPANFTYLLQVQGVNIMSCSMLKTYLLSNSNMMSSTYK